MAINNPYIPGDPYSYDLKWIISRIKAHDAILEDLNETLDTKIEAAIWRFLDQHDPVYFENAQALIDSNMSSGSIAYIEGFYIPGDNGANLYFITSDYNDVLTADFYLTLAGANRWALPIFTTPYATPEMFGAYGDDIHDDGAAWEKACHHGLVYAKPNTTYLVDTTIMISNNVVIVGSNATFHMPSKTTVTYIFDANLCSFEIKDAYFVSENDQNDASIYNRPGTGVYSNVTPIQWDNGDRFVMKNIIVTNCQELCKLNDRTEINKAKEIIIDECVGEGVQAWIFCSNADTINIRNQKTIFANNSNLDHMVYESHSVDDIIMDNLYTTGSVGAPIHIYGVSGFTQAAKRAVLTNSYIKADYGIYFMGTESAVVSNCTLDITSTVNHMALRNKGGKVTFENLDVKCYDLLYCETNNDGTTPPETMLKNCKIYCERIQSFQDAVSVPQTVYIEGNDIQTVRGGNFDGQIMANAASTYTIINNIIRKFSTNVAALVYCASGQPTVHIYFNYLYRGLSLYNGDATNVRAMKNCAYTEKGALVGTEGVWIDNTIYTV